MLKDLILLFLLSSLLTWVCGGEVAISDGGGKREAVHQRVALTPHLQKGGFVNFRCRVDLFKPFVKHAAYLLSRVS